MIRTPREWDEPCPKCRGAGVVHKRESFHLLTPEEYVALMQGTVDPPKLDAKYDVPADAVVCTPCGSVSIFEACTEGVTLARAYGRPVVFEFNGRVVVCSSDSNPEDVAKRWWKRAYGETYEESVEKR